MRRAGTTGITLQGCASADLQLAAGDIAIVNSYDATSGELRFTETKGGDSAAVGPRSVGMTYTAGGYLKTKSLGAFTWKAIDRLVDFKTGLTFETHDPAGNRVNYMWDGLGRLTSIAPPSPEKPTTITYTSLRETRVRQDWSSSNFVETAYLYDDLGRLTQTRRRNIGSGYDVQFTEYDVASRITRKSEWALENTPAAQLKWTTYDYRSTYQPLEPIPGYPTTFPDPLGRIHGVTTPDDPTPATPTVETNYYGNTTVVTVRDIRGAVNGNDAALTSTTVYSNDDLGRLVAVDSPANGVDASYEYDDSDNLVEVRLKDPASPSHVQIRRFAYDRLSRLRSATHPEAGVVEYNFYDARGNLLSFTDARMNTFKLTYDAADRLLTKKQTINGADVLLAENLYDEGVLHDAGGAEGRLVQQTSFEPEAQVSLIRFHYAEPNTHDACSLGTRGYAGLNGRLAWQTTSLTGWNSEVKTEYCQDEMGMPYLFAYPDVAGSGRSRSKLAYNYKNGYMWEMHDLARDLQLIRNVNYGPGGVATSVTRGNGLLDTIELDVRNRPARYSVQGYSIPIERPALNQLGVCGGPSGNRPEEIVICAFELDPEIASPTTLWDSGLYSYDMAGNIRSIGTTEQYYYDELNRLTRAVVMAPNALIHDQVYSFDAFGNMFQHKDTLSTAINTPKYRDYTIQWETNRLTQQSRTNYGTFPAVSYGYDASGNLISEGGKGFTFDGEARLREITDSSLGRIGTYHYDASGYRVRGEADRLDTFYLRDASGQVLSEFSRRVGVQGAPAPGWSKDYVYALGKAFALVKNDIPERPKKPWTTVVSPTAISLQWSPLGEPDIAGYSLERSTRPNTTAAWGTPTTFSFSVGATGYTDSLGFTADADTLVKYVLRAMDGAGNFSDPAPNLVVRPGPNRPLPPTPTNFLGTAGDRAVTLTWNPVTLEGLDLWGYRVEILNGQVYQPLHSGVLPDTRFYHTGLTNDQAYTYRVLSVDTAGHSSTPSASLSKTPHDTTPPGQLTDVRAYPDRAAGKVLLLWQRGLQPDVASYRVVRSTDGGTPSAIFTWTVTDDREDYSYLDGAATQGHTYAYSVEALDAASPPNVSAASAQVSVRPRHSSVVAPSLSQAGSGFTVNTNGAPSLDGVPGSGQEDWDNTWAEDDDVMSFSMNITGGGTAVSYGIYRKAPDEDHYSLVGTIAQPTSGDNIFNDTTIVKGTYDYFVTRRSMVGSVLEESAGSTSVVGTDRPLPAAAASVRNLCVRDSRNEYTTANSESRVTRIYWSRVVEPDVRGYNVYRKCRFTGCGGFTYGMETFACEPAWTRVNASLLPPTTREFQDSSVGGLQGCFLYAVRPVGSSLDEGQITKVVGTALWARQTKGELHATSCDAVQGDYSDDQSFAYAEIAPAINSQARGSGSASAPVPAPQNVIRQQVFPKPVFEGQWSVSEVAQVTWSTQEPVPRDLKGFHVEMAGSPNGPWARLTKNPVAWWERHYSVQGSFDLNTHRATCASFRVIAIDEDGNESTATPAQYNPSPSSCPTTAPAPSNLRATTIDPPGTSQDATRLEWDASPAADEYYVYRLVNEPGRFFFYITAIVPAPPSGTPFFDEKGDWTSATCPYQNPTHDCLLKLLDVYYVTAR